MKHYLLGLGLFLGVSFLDISQGSSVTWAYDLPSAQTAYKQKDFGKVVSLLSPEIEKLNRESLLLLAKSYSALNKHDPAIKTLNACLALNPKDFEAKTMIGTEQLAMNRDAEALITLKEALEINPRSSMAYKALSQYYEKRKNNYELRLLYEDMLAKVGEKPETVTRLCSLCTEDRFYELALKYCQRGIQLSPNEPSNYVYLGITFKETDSKEKAGEALKKAAQDYPQSAFSQLTYAKFLDEQKNFVTSYGLYKKATTADPKSAEAFVGLANSSFELQKYSDSLAAFEKACALDRKILPAFRKAAITLRSMKNSDWLKQFETSIEKCN
jgi:tetratricopeptide (TPR) repeat protein